MDIELQTQATNPALALRGVRRHSDGPSAAYEATLIVRSGGFSAERAFFFDEYHLSGFIESLVEMDRAFRGTARLGHQWEDQFIELTVDASGHVLVSGSLVEHDVPGQRLDFAFRTDQTVLRPLIRDLGHARGAGQTTRPEPSNVALQLTNERVRDPGTRNHRASVVR